MERIFSKSWLKVIVLGLCLVFFGGSAFAQNTKGDRPAKGNQRQVRETRSKSVKKKSRGRTKDIAGRRLRTKGTSSANRANANIRQPSTYTKHPDGRERAAAPRGRTFTRSPRESRSRAWKGDISRYPMRRMKPSGHDAARNNVYPQKGPYVRYARKQPKEKHADHTKTIKGKPFVKHKPRAKERAWQGGLEHGPLRNVSATGSIRNTYSQRGPYVAYYHKRARKETPPYNNRRQVSKVKRYSRAAVTGGSQPRVYPSSRTRPYVQRGRKNVYWGKYQKKTRAVTTDITGGPLRTRNYKSPTAGLVGRDTLAFFGRKPSRDRAARAPSAGYRTATRKGSRGWKGDVAGWPVRSPRKPINRAQNPLTPTEPGIGGWWLKKIFNNNFRGVRPKDRIPDTREAKYQGNIPRQDVTKAFDSQGAGYSGNIKRGRGPARARTDYSGRMKRGGKGFDLQYVGYSGNMKRGKGFDLPYAGYSGNIKRGKGFDMRYAGYSGNIKRGKGFDMQYAGYSGNIKGRKEFNGDYIGYSGTLKRGERGFSGEYIGYSGNLKYKKTKHSRDGAGYRGDIPHLGRVKEFEIAGVNYRGFMKREVRGFGDQGEGFGGNIKTKRPNKGGGSVSGSLWNNNQSALARNPPLVGGINYSGRQKAKRPDKGGGTVSGVLWNNNQSALQKNPPLVGGINYSGRQKARRPEKGGGTVSGVLWNNRESALAKSAPGSLEPFRYSGRNKATKPLKGGGTVSGIKWNNNESALAKKLPSGATDIRTSKVRVKAKDVSRNKNASREALPGVAPTRASVKAGEYVRVMKMTWNYKRNPNSSSAALKTIAPGKAEGRINDYQGNVKMRKHTLRGLHPDAKFAHLEEDNVKQERGLLTNVKLFWEKMFKKNATQPSNLKEKQKKLQYDKREKGLWAY